MVVVVVVRRLPLRSRDLIPRQRLTRVWTVAIRQHFVVAKFQWSSYSLLLQRQQDGDDEAPRLWARSLSSRKRNPTRLLQR